MPLTPPNREEEDMKYMALIYDDEKKMADY
jgi:hypothetical protein